MRIRLRFPVNWDLKMKFALAPDVVAGNRWMRAVRCGDELTAVVAHPVSEREISFHGPEELVDKVVQYLGLHDPEELYAFMERDEKLRILKEKFYGFGRAGLMSMTVYEGFVKAIIQQQISFSVAEKITARIVERFGERVEFEGQRLYEFPAPEALATSVDELRECGLSRRKAETIVEISKTALNFDFEKLRDMDEDEVFEILTSFKGVGRWTAELVMSMAIGMNVFPADDLGVRRAVSSIFDTSQDPETVREVATRFGKFSRDILFYLFLHDRLKKS